MPNGSKTGVWKMSEFCIPLYRLLFGATRKLNLLFLLGTFASIMLKKHGHLEFQSHKRILLFWSLHENHGDGKGLSSGNLTNSLKANDSTANSSFPEDSNDAVAYQNRLP